MSKIVFKSATTDNKAAFTNPFAPKNNGGASTATPFTGAKPAWGNPFGASKPAATTTAESLPPWLRSAASKSADADKKSVESAEEADDEEEETKQVAEAKTTCDVDGANKKF